jgi:hypothetical protein
MCVSCVIICNSSSNLSGAYHTNFPGESQLTFYSVVRNLSAYCHLCQNIRVKICNTVVLPVLYGCETWTLTLSLSSMIQSVYYGFLGYDVEKYCM